MEEHTFLNVNNCLSTCISYYLERAGGQSSYLHLSVVHLINISVNLTSVAA